MNARTTARNCKLFAAIAILVFSLVWPLTAAAAPDPQAGHTPPRNAYPKVYRDPDTGTKYTTYIDEENFTLAHFVLKTEAPGEVASFTDQGVVCPAHEFELAELIGGYAAMWIYHPEVNGWELLTAVPVDITLQFGSFREASGEVHRSNWWHKFTTTNGGYFFCHRYDPHTLGDD